MSRRSIEEHDGDPEVCALCSSLATFILDGRTPLCADHLDLAMEYEPPSSQPAPAGRRPEGGNVSTPDSLSAGGVEIFPPRHLSTELAATTPWHPGENQRAA